MAETHVISAPKEKRIKIASEIEGLQSRLRKAVIDLDHIEASLRLFDPDVDIGELVPRKVPQVLFDTKGDTGRIILDTPRTATAPPHQQDMRSRDEGPRPGHKRQGPMPPDDEAHRRQPEALAYQARADPAQAQDRDNS